MFSWYHFFLIFTVCFKLDASLEQHEVFQLIVMYSYDNIVSIVMLLSQLKNNKECLVVQISRAE